MDEKILNAVRENGYRLCGLDLQDILWDLRTPENIILLVEIGDRIQHALEIRMAAGFELVPDEN